MSVYLIRTREFKESDKPIYKIGRTSQPVLNRTNSYSKGSELILTCKCLYSDSKNIENIIKREFSKFFKLRKDLGSTETFEGDVGLMRNHMLNILDRFDTDVTPMDIG